ncbi:hypothetical protein [Microbaculum marinum]|uniref:Uncharacterized protein n=1 Tax=Microbaculum marinum TaxID=1764581 RepID=A0AAW9RNP6_9HYPH
MKKLILSAVALLTLVTFGGEPASAANTGISGTWLIKYYNRNGVYLSQQCILFVQTNNIAGYRKYSGTWGLVGSKTVGGQWVQEGDDLMWYGVSGKAALSAVGDITTKNSIGGTGYVQFQTSNGGTIAAGNWTGKKSARCN